MAIVLLCVLITERRAHHRQTDRVSFGTNPSAPPIQVLSGEFYWISERCRDPGEEAVLDFYTICSFLLQMYHFQIIIMIIIIYFLLFISDLELQY